MEYLEWLGSTFGKDLRQEYARSYQDRRLRLKLASAAIRFYEYELSRAMLDVLQEMPGVRLYGPSDVHWLDQRVPTFSFTLKGWHPRQLAERLNQEGIYSWDGNYYALGVTERLGLEESGGLLRVGAVHYNTVEEVHRFGEALARIIKIA